ncbi:MAG: hypothetical protein E3K36_17245 [Candidatus Brocadia sp.]|nr:hypothetical protein [Candidatus Brocadia sp.]
MNKMYLFTVTLFLSTCHMNTILARSGFEPVINGVVNDAINNAVSKEQVDKISNTMSKAADVYYSAKSSAIETQMLLSGTATQQTKRTQEILQTQKTQETREAQKTATHSKILYILKKIEAAFLDASLNSNNHQ